MSEEEDLRYEEAAALVDEAQSTYVDELARLFMAAEDRGYARAVLEAEKKIKFSFRAPKDSTPASIARMAWEFIADEARRAVLENLDDLVNLLEAPPGESADSVVAMQFALAVCLPELSAKAGLADYDDAEERMLILSKPAATSAVRSSQFKEEIRLAVRACDEILDVVEEHLAVAHGTREERTPTLDALETLMEKHGRL